MIKRVVLCALALALLCTGCALAQQRSFSQDMKDFGAYLGEKMAQFGQQVQLFSQDPQGYIESSGAKERIAQLAKEAGQSLEEYWPTFKASVKGAVQSMMDSDLTWEQKVDRLKEYGEMAVPILADADFEAMGEEARLALAAIKGLMGFETDEQTKQWIADNAQKLQEIREYLAS